MTRVTNSIYFESMIRNIQDSFEELNRLQNQLQTQKAYERPSENPVQANQAILLESNLKQIEQSTENVSNGYDLLTYSDQILDNVLVPLNTALEKTAQGLNAENDAVSRQAIGNELQAILDTIISIGNSQLGDKNIFGGSQYLEPVFQNLGNDILFNGNNNEFKVNVFGNERIQSNITATQAFGASSTILDSDRNLDAKLSRLNIDFSVPLDRSRVKTATELQVLGKNDIADAFQDAGGDRATMITQLNAMNTATDFDDIQAYTNAVRDAAVTALGGNTIATMTSVEATQVKAAIDAAATFYRDNSNTLVLQEGQESLSAELSITLTSTNSNSTTETISTINTTVRAYETEVTNYAKIEAVNAFYETLDDKSDVSISDTFANNVSNIVTDANTTSITYAASVQTQALLAIGKTYDALTSNEKQQVDAAVNAARNAYAKSEFKAVQSRSGMVITHEIGDQVSINDSQTQSVIVNHFKGGHSLNRNTYVMETGLTAAIAADDEFTLTLSDGNTMNVSVYNGDTVDVVAKRINQAINKMNVNDGFRDIVAQVDNSELILSNTEHVALSGSNDITDTATVSHSGLYTSANNVDDLRNGNGFEYGTQKISADQLITELGVTNHLVRGDIVTIREGDSMEYLIQQLNDLDGFDATLNEKGTGIDFQNMRRYSTVLKQVDTTNNLTDILPITDTLTITDEDGSISTVDFAATATLSEMAEQINAASSTNTKIFATVNEDGDALVVSSNESLSLAFTTNTGLDVLSSQMTDLSNDTVISSNMIRSLGVERLEDENGLISGETILGRQTKLSELNDGDGITKGSIQISISSVSYQIDLSNAVTLSDVKTLIEDGTGDLASVTINDSGNGLSIQSNSDESMTISELEGGSIGRQLGLIAINKTSESGTDIQGSDLDPRFVGKTLLSDLNGGNGIDNTGFVIYNGERSGVITLDSDGDGVDDIRTLNDLVNHINTRSTQDDLYVEASLVPETGQIKFTSKLSNTTLSVKERAAHWNRFVVEDIPASPAAATTLTISNNTGTTVDVAIGAGDTAQTMVDNINAAAATASFDFKARINSDGKVEITSSIGISATYLNSYTARTFQPIPSILGTTASDLGLLGNFSSTSLLSTLNNGTGIENGTFNLTYGSYVNESYFVTIDPTSNDSLTFYNENASTDNSNLTIDMSQYTSDAALINDINTNTELNNMGFSASLDSSGTGVKVTASDRFTLVGNDAGSINNYVTHIENYQELNSSATTVAVDLEFAETLLDVKNAIETATDGDVLVEFGHANRIELRLASNDQNQGILIEELSSSADVANSLGLMNPDIVFGRNLRDGSSEILSNSTLLSDLGLEFNDSANTYSGENDLVLLVDSNLVTLDLSSTRTVGDVISLINSTTISDNKTNIELSAKIVKGQYLSIEDQNGGTMQVLQSGFSEAAEKLGLVSDPDIEDESTYFSYDLNPENQTLNVFSVLTNLRDEFRKGDVDESAISRQLNLLESVRDQFLNSRGEAGSRISRFDLLRTRFEEEKVFVQDLYSQKIDIDIISTTQKFLAQQQIYQSGLSAASRVLGTSLFNFL